MMRLVLLALALITLTVDWRQTRYIARYPERFSEMNVVLGTHPSVGRVDAYFAVCMLVTGAAAWLLPLELSYWLLGGVAALEIAVTVRNKTLGIRTIY